MVTLAICLAFGLEIGMLVGIVANLVLLLHRTARPTILFEESCVNEQRILVVIPQQSINFPAAEYLRERVMRWSVLLLN